MNHLDYRNVNNKHILWGIESDRQRKIWSTKWCFWTNNTSLVVCKKTADFSENDVQTVKCLNAYWPMLKVEIVRDYSGNSTEKIVVSSYGSKRKKWTEFKQGTRAVTCKTLAICLNNQKPVTGRAIIIIIIAGSMKTISILLKYSRMSVCARFWCLPWLYILLWN